MEVEDSDGVSGTSAPAGETLRDGGQGTPYGQVAQGTGQPGDPGSWTGSPSRLHTLVAPSSIDPPVETRPQVLPFDGLAWENFERLCLRLAGDHGAVDHSVDHAGGDVAAGRMSAREARLYGARGQDQQGIDLYVRLPPTGEGPGLQGRRYLSLQSRRIASLAPAQLSNAATEFLGGSWAAASRVFVFATSLSAIRRELADEIRIQAERLAREGIEFEVWDAEVMSPWLKERPSLVYDFFGRAWAERFCGPEAVARLGTRLEAGQVGALRDRLRRFYATAFDVTDSGMVALRRANVPRLGLRERFVLPDVMVTSTPGLGAAARPGQEASLGDNGLAGDGTPDALVPDDWYRQAQSARYGRSGLASPASATAPDRAGSQPEAVGSGGLQLPSAGIAVRTDADTWLASGQRHVLVGDPGSGKSTFLRYVVLDVLSDSPTMTRWAERFGDRLPVWLPFHFFTARRARNDGASASLAATLRAWLEQNDAGELWDLVELALSDERLLLIIDGLDEWVNETAGRSAAAAVETFLGERQLPALVSTRPYGLTRMSLAGEWDYASIAALSPAQQRQLASLWFDAAGSGPGGQQPKPTQSGPETQAVHAFMAEIDAAVELRQLAGTALFLLLLVGLRLSGVPLPARRFEVYESVVQQLLKDHPATRATAAGVTSDHNVLPADDVRQVLAHVAFLQRLRGDLGPVPEMAVRADLLEALKDPGHLAMDAQSAARTVRPFVEIAEGQLGVLVRYGHRELGFLHRVFLEELAAEHAADRLSASDLLDMFTDRARDPRWSQVLLAVLWRNKRPGEVSQLVQVIADQAQDDRTAALTARELLAEAVFGGYRLPATDTARHARAILDTVEAHPYLAHRRRLLSACAAGLASPAGVFLRERLSRWTLAPQPLPPGLFHQLGKAARDSELDAPVWPLLTAALTLEDLAAVSSAARALAGRYGGNEHAGVHDTLLSALRNAATADHAALILLSLTLGWPGDRDIRELVSWARRQEVLPVRVVALGAVLGVLRRTVTTPDAPAEPLTGVAALSEPERAWLISQLHTNDASGDLWHPFLTHAVLGVARDQPATWERVRDDSLSILDKDHRTRGDRALAWAVLMLGWPEDAAVQAYVCTVVRTDLHYIHFLGQKLLALAYPDNPAVAQAVEDALRADGPGQMASSLHALAAVDHGPVIRGELLKSLTSGAFPHWAADALATYWAEDEEVHAALRAVLEGEPGRASYAANAAIRVLGRPAAVERLLALLTAPPDGHTRVRRDFIAYALIDACQDEGGAPGPASERIAAACLAQLDDPDDEYEAAAEAAVVAALAATRAAKDRAVAMLARPQPPLAALAAGYGHDTAAMRPVLQQLRAAHPPLPASLRARLCTLLRDSPADHALIRDLTRRWADEPDDLVASAASAAYHSCLRRDRLDGTLPAGEWDTALAVLRREAVKGSYVSWGRRRGAWLGALLLDQAGLLDDLREPYGEQPPARLPLGEATRPVDMILLSEVADRWPTLRNHFGDRLLDRLTGDMFTHDSGAAWNYLALVAARQPLLNRDLAQAVTAQPDLLAHDGVLAWYASAHRGDDDLPGVLISHLEDGSNARALASMLLAEPRALGLDPGTVQARLRAQFDPQRLWYPPDQSGALEALADGFPGDAIVQKCWDLVVERRQRGEPADMHPRTYFPLAYAAVPAAGILDLIAGDIQRMAAWGDTYFDPQFARAVIHRLRRDADARSRLEASIMNTQTPDTTAGPLASLLAAAYPLSHDLAQALTSRHQRQLLLPAPDMTHDYVSGTDLPVPLLLLRVLDSGVPSSP
jgi:NACHT domain